MSSFPSWFPADIISEIEEQGYKKDLDVYRICKWGKIDKKAFLSTYEEAEVEENTFQLNKFKNRQKIDNYSTSCNLNKEELEEILDMYMRRKNPKAIISFGVTKKDYGLIREKANRTSTENGHVDWWLYDDSEPYTHFKEVFEDDDK